LLSRQRSDHQQLISTGWYQTILMILSLLLSLILYAGGAVTWTMSKHLAFNDPVTKMQQSKMQWVRGDVVSKMQR
jgi:hypothetical protein